MPQLQVAYEPNPIPWIIPQAPEEQSGPGQAHVTLTVSAIDADSGASVAGMVNSWPFLNPEAIDPNSLSFPTNTPQVITLLQTTWVSLDIIYGPPVVQVTADGYEDAYLLLE